MEVFLLLLVLGDYDSIWRFLGTEEHVSGNGSSSWLEHKCVWGVAATLKSFQCCQESLFDPLRSAVLP